MKPKTKPGRSNATARDNQRSYISVLLYVPNLIGYARVLLTGMFFYYAFDTQAGACSACYIASFTLDFFDGYFARLLDQCSRLGQVLDMVTDRVSTAILLVVLSMLQPGRSSIYVFLLALDFSSHWFHMKSAGEGYHKKVDEKRNIILHTDVLRNLCLVWLLLCQRRIYVHRLVRSSLPTATCVTNNWPVFAIVSVVFVGPGLCDQEYCKCCAAFGALCVPLLRVTRRNTIRSKWEMSASSTTYYAIKKRTKKVKVFLNVRGISFNFIRAPFGVVCVAA